MGRLFKSINYAYIYIYLPFIFILTSNLSSLILLICSFGYVVINFGLVAGHRVWFYCHCFIDSG